MNNVIGPILVAIVIGGVPGTLLLTLGTRRLRVSLARRNWPKTEALVTSVEMVEVGNHRRHKRYATKVTYSYAIDGVPGEGRNVHPEHTYAPLWQEEILISVVPLGSRFPARYNPDDRSEIYLSVDVLPYQWIAAIMGSVFWFFVLMAPLLVLTEQSGLLPNVTQLLQTLQVVR